MTVKTTDYGEFKNEVINKRIGDFYDFSKREKTKHANDVDKLIELLMNAVSESFGNTAKLRASSVLSSGASAEIFSKLDADVKGVELGEKLVHSFETLVGMAIIRQYLGASYRLKKNTFQQAADHMTKRLKGTKIDFSATNATNNLYKKSGSDFRPSKDFGEFAIDGVRYGPRDGLILQLSKGGYFYELAAHIVPKLDRFTFEYGKVQENPPLQNEIFYAMVDGLTQRCGVTFNDTMDSIEEVLDDTELPSYLVRFEWVGAGLKKSEEKEKEVKQDIRKEIPNFGMWG